MRRDEERERSLISDGEDNNNTKKRDTFFFCDTQIRAGTTTRHGWDEIYLFLSLSLSINMLYGLLCVFG